MSEKTEQIKLWIEKADHDLGTAIITHRYIPKYRDTIAFHCQQAVEKYLKSYIFKLKIKVKKTHDLVFLLELIDEKEKIDQLWFDKVFELQDFAIEIRYPDQIIELTDEDIKEAIKIAQEFREMILKRHNIDFKFEDLGSSPSN
jgi:HEPN domain-containing protein